MICGRPWSAFGIRLGNLDPGHFYGRSGARQRVAQIKENHVQVRVSGRGGYSSVIDVPGTASEVRVLEHEGERTVLGVPPEGLRQTKGRLLNGAILAGRRPGVTVTEGRYFCDGHGRNV